MTAADSAPNNDEDDDDDDEDKTAQCEHENKFAFGKQQKNIPQFKLID